MFKRIFWLSLVFAAGLVIWLRLRQRQDQLAAYSPQFAPHQPFIPPSPAPPALPVPAPPSAPVADTAAADTAAPTPIEPAAPAAEDAPPTEAPTTSDGSASEPADELGDVVGYCVRCKTKRTISDAHEETTESGRRAARGTCPVCGANMFTFLAMNDDEPADEPQA